MKRARLPMLCLSVLLLVSAPGCGDDDGGNENTNVNENINVPAFALESWSPPDGATLGVDTSIQATFNQNVEPASVTLGGELGPQATATVNGPVVTIEPLTGWLVGPNQNVVLGVSSAHGEPLQVSATFDVNADVLTAQENPQSGAIVDDQQVLTVTFSRPVDPTTLVLGGALGPDASTPAWAEGDTVVTVTPTTAWSSGASQTLDIQVAAPGEAASDFSFHWTVDGDGPAVIEWFPAAGGLLDASGLLRVTFDEAVDTSTLVLNGDLAPHAEPPVWSAGNTVLELWPTSLWTGGYGLTIDLQVSDLLGNVGGGSATFDVDVMPPAVDQILPPDQSLLGATTPIQITWTETLDASTLVLGGDLGAEVGGIAWSGVGEVMTLTPTTTWTDGVGRTLTLQASDPVGNQSTVQSYTYDVDATPPQVLLVTPVLELSPWSQISVQFSEDLDPASLTFGGTLGAVQVAQWIDPQNVVLAPVTEWNLGLGLELNLGGADLVGNPLPGGGYDHAFNVRWNVVVDATDDVGQYTSLAFDATGQTAYVSYHGATAGAVYFARSDDGGDNWGAPVVAAAGDGDTALVVNGNAVHVIYRGNSGLNGYPDLMHIRSDDNGATWPTANIVTINEGERPGSFAGYFGTSAALAHDGASLYAVTHEYWCFSGVCDYYARFSRSIDGGTSWPTELSKTTGCMNLRSANRAGIAADNGAVYVAGYTLTSSTTRYLALARSFNDGVDWDCITIDHPANYVGQHASLGLWWNGAVHHLYVSYYDATAGDLKFAKSEDDGATWAPMTVDGNGGDNVGTHTSLAVSADGQTVYVAYHDETNGDLKFARSDDAGATWTTFRSVDAEGNVGQHVSLAIAGNGATTVVGITYYDLDNGDLKFARSLDNGDTW